MDDSAAAFPDTEAGLLFLIDHPQALPAKGTLKIELSGPTTKATRYLLDALPESVAVTGEVGVTLGWQYNFKGGAFVKSIPGS